MRARPAGPAATCHRPSRCRRPAARTARSRDRPARTRACPLRVPLPVRTGWRARGLLPRRRCVGCLELDRGSRRPGRTCDDWPWSRRARCAHQRGENDGQPRAGQRALRAGRQMRWIAGFTALPTLRAARLPRQPYESPLQGGTGGFWCGPVWSMPKPRLPGQTSVNDLERVQVHAGPPVRPDHDELDRVAGVARPGLAEHDLA